MVSLCIVVLVLFHDVLYLLGDHSACELGDDNHVLRVGGVVFDLRERFNTGGPLAVLHNDGLAEVIDRGC